MEGAGVPVGAEIWEVRADWGRMIGIFGSIHTGAGGQNRVSWEIGAWARSGAARQPGGRWQGPADAGMVPADD